MAVTTGTIEEHAAGALVGFAGVIGAAALGPADAEVLNALAAATHVSVRRLAFGGDYTRCCVRRLPRAHGIAVDSRTADLLAHFLAAQASALRFIRHGDHARPAADLAALCLLLGDRDVDEEELCALLAVRPARWYENALPPLLALRHSTIARARRVITSLPAPAPITHAPTAADAALVAGRTLRSASLYSLADAWFMIARVVALDATDPVALMLAHVGLGKVHKLRGGFPRAARHYRRALRVATAWGVKGQALAFARHDLGALAAELGDGKAARRELRKAFRAYPADSWHRVAVLHDYSFLLLEEGRFSAALDFLLMILPRCLAMAPGYRMLALASVVRAAGGAGERAVYDKHIDAAWTAAVDGNQSPESARSLLNIATGAHTLKEWRRAEFAAEMARSIAERHGEHRIVRMAQVIGDAASAHAAVRWVNQRPDVGDSRFAAEAARAMAAEAAL